MRNGFAHDDPTTNPLLAANPNLDKPVVENHFGNSINGLEFTDKTPLDKGSPCRFSPARSPEQVTDELKGNDPHVPVNGASVKSDVKKFSKRTKQQCTYLGFKNKKMGHLISRKLRNRNDTHLSLINPIEIDEGSNPEIEYFLSREYP
jgi:hypothetical protein